MLGKSVADPEGIEGQPGSSNGLGWLDIDTQLAAHKQLKEVKAVLASSLFVQSQAGDSEAGDKASSDPLVPARSDVSIRGYEIHCGVSHGPGLDRPALLMADGRHDGAVAADGQVFGTYMHGVFDGPEACAALLQWAGLDGATTVDIDQRREQDLERLADCVEQHLDLTILFPLLSLSRGSAETFPVSLASSKTAV